MKKGYVICPGYVFSKNDGDRHFISSGQLAGLYGVSLNADNVLVAHSKKKYLLRYGIKEEDWVWLHPREDGNYELPPLTKPE